MSSVTGGAHARAHSEVVTAPPAGSSDVQQCMPAPQSDGLVHASPGSAEQDHAPPALRQKGWPSGQRTPLHVARSRGEGRQKPSRQA
jgi:hypothetical protein